MKKRDVKKLKFGKETLRVLREECVEEAVGGTGYDSHNTCVLECNSSIVYCVE